MNNKTNELKLSWDKKISMREMAQTRAVGRALRWYTGYGSTTYEELPDAVVEGEQ